MKVRAHNDKDCVVGRVRIDVVDDVDIFQFQTQLEMEYYSLLDSPIVQPKCFKGFREVDPVYQDLRRIFREATRDVAVDEDDDCILIDGPEVIVPKPICVRAQSKKRGLRGSSKHLALRGLWRVKPNPKEEVKEVVQGLVNFVCRQEDIDALKIRQDVLDPCTSTVARCGQEFCVLGCVCHSISRRSTRRIRCENLECIFGCRCWGTVDKRLRSGHNPLPVLHDPLPDVPKVEENPHPLLPPAAPIVTIDLTRSQSFTFNRINSFTNYKPLPYRKWKPNVLKKPFYSPYEAFKKKKPFVNTLKGIVEKPEPKILLETTKNMLIQPSHALICLTPGIGYIPLKENSSNRVRLWSPFKSQCIETFLDIKSAIDWLNEQLKQKLKFDSTLSNLVWLVADSSIIEKKNLQKIDVEFLVKCRITKSGPTFP